MSKSTGRCARNDPDADGSNVVMFSRDSKAQEHNNNPKNITFNDVQTALVSDLFSGPIEVTDDERDRLTRLEVQFTHLAKSMDDTHEKVTIMHDLLMQAKGMKYLIMVMATIGGGVSALVVKYIPFMRT